MSTDTQLSQRSSAMLVGGAFVLLPVGLLIVLLTRGEESRGYPVFGTVLILTGWVLLGVGLAQVCAKVDELYRYQVTRSRARS